MCVERRKGGRPAGLEIWGDRGGGGRPCYKAREKRGWDWPAFLSFFRNLCLLGLKFYL